MALEEIVQETTGLCKDEKPIIVQFEPWNFSSTEQLLEQFFACFKTALNVSDDSVKLGQIGSILEKYSSSLNYLKYIPKIGSYVDTIPKLVGKLGKQLTCTSESIASDASAQKRMAAFGFRHYTRFALFIPLLGFSLFSSGAFVKIALNKMERCAVDQKCNKS